MRREGEGARWLELGLAALGYLGVTLWWLWPLPAALATHAEFHPQSSAWSVLRSSDYYLLLWVLSWGAHALVEAPLQVFHANVFHPSPLSLAYSEHLLGLQPLFAPVYWGTGNAVLGANVTIVLSLVGSALATYALARRWVGVPAACLAGLLFAFAPVDRQTLHHFHLLPKQYLPLAILFADRWLADGRRRDFMGLVVAVVLGVTGSMYLTYAFAFAVGPVAVLALLRWRARLDGRRLGGLVGAAVIGGLALAVVALPYLQLRMLGLIPEYGESGRRAVGAMFAQRLVTERFTVGAHAGVVLALVLLGLVAAGRGRRWPGVIGATLTVVGLVVALGPQVVVGGVKLALPHALLATLVPGFSTVRVVSRLAVVATLGLALLAALGADRCCRIGPAVMRPVVVLLVAVLGLVHVAPATPLTLRAVLTCAEAHAAYAWLARHGGGRPLLELPPMRGEQAAEMMYRSTCHWLPTIGGSSAYPTQVHELVYAIARGLPNAAAAQRLVDHVDVRWVLVWLEAEWNAPWRRPNLKLPAGLAIAARWHDAVIVRVDAEPGPASVRDRLLSTTQTLDGAPLASLDGPCPGRIELVSPPSRVPGWRSLRARVRIHNDGERTLPGRGYVPRHLVHVRACLRAAGATECNGKLVPLGVDVPVGGSEVVGVNVARSPIISGEPRLIVELVQMGDGPLAACGLMPLDVEPSPAS